MKKSESREIETPSPYSSITILPNSSMTPDGEHAPPGVDEPIQLIIPVADPLPQQILPVKFPVKFDTYLWM